MVVDLKSDATSSASGQACSHCGLPVTPNARESFGSFCCQGCQTVYRLIHEEGLEQFYAYRRDSEAMPPGQPSESFTWLEPVLANAETREDGAWQRVRLDIQGVHCAACIWLLQQLWERRAGALDLRINPALGRVQATWDPKRLDLLDYLQEAERFGYRFGPPTKTPLRSSRSLVLRLGVCVALALNTMTFSLAFYFGLGADEPKLHALFGRLSLGMATGSALIGGSLFLGSALRALRRGIVHFDLPIALGITLGYLGSVLAWIGGGPDAAYFDTVTIFIALMVAGRWLQDRVLQRNRHTLLESTGIEGLVTRRRVQDRVETIPASEVVRGDELWILPGDLAPVEGILLDRDTEVGLEWTTGESAPVAISPGERVPAGALNLTRRRLRMTATESLSESQLPALFQPSTKDEAAHKDPWWHRISTAYVIGVLVVATLGFAFWLSAGLPRAIEVAVALLVVTCPCAIGLAAPLATELVHVALRRRGVFLRAADYLSRACQIRKILFDKTGTLTTGTLRPTEESLGAIQRRSREERDILAYLALNSLHPASRGLLAALGGEAAVRLRNFEVFDHPGIGVSATVDGVRWSFGRHADATARSSDYVATFARDGVPVLVVHFEETLKEGATQEVRALQEEGMEIHILSGDASRRVGMLARQLDLPTDRVHGDLTPEEKAKIVERIDRRDTLMVGDGLNDAPSFTAAFAAATPGIDRPHLPARSDFFFLGSGVDAVRVSLRFAQRLRSLHKQLWAVALTYNAVAIGLGFAGLITPVTAAVLMPLSSVALILLVTLRLSERRGSWK